MGGNQSAEAAGPRNGPNIYLNVYDSGKDARQMPGFGVYHSGLEVMGTEYTFAGGDFDGSGVQEQTPKSSPPGSQWVYKETVDLGKTDLTESEVRSVLSAIRADFPAKRYDVMGSNCNHFTETLSLRLHVGSKYPSWVNRAAKWGGGLKGGGLNPVALEQRKMQEEKERKIIADRERQALQSRQTTLLKPEPPIEAEGAIEVQVNCPNGTKAKRRFVDGDTIQDVMNLVAAHDLSADVNKFYLRVNMPRTVFDQPKKTLKEAGFSRRENLFVEKRK